MSQNNLYTIKNPLKREGTSQRQRQLATLDPASVKIDERTLQDFLVYAGDFARQIYYYNKNNELDGDWQDFFVYDLSFILASIEKANPQKGKDEFKKLYGEKPSLEGLEQLFQNIKLLVKKIDDWYINLPEGNDVKDQMLRITHSNLEGFLSKLLAYELGAYKEFEDDGYLQPQFGTYTTMSGIWNMGNPNKILPDLKLFKPVWEPPSEIITRH